MKSQIVTSNWGGTRKYPYAFTREGIAMLSGVLKSDVAIQANISIMRAFVQMNEYLQTTAILSAELKELKTKVDLLQHQQEEDLGTVNELSEDVRKDIDNLYLAIGQLAEKLDTKKKTPAPKIGFKQAAGIEEI